MIQSFKLLQELTLSGSLPGCSLSAKTSWVGSLAKGLLSSNSRLFRGVLTCFSFILSGLNKPAVSMGGSPKCSGAGGESSGTVPKVDGPEDTELFRVDRDGPVSAHNSYTGKSGVKGDCSASTAPTEQAGPSVLATRLSHARSFQEVKATVPSKCS